MSIPVPRSSEPAEETIRILQQELADTNREVLLLTLELEKRVDERTAELRSAQDHLRHTNRQLLQLASHLEERVGERTSELEVANGTLRKEIADRKRVEQNLQAQLSRLDLLHRITRAIGERQDLSSIFQVVIRSLEDYLPLDFGCIGLYHAADDEIELSALGNSRISGELGFVPNVRIALRSDRLAACLKGQLLYEPDISAIDLSLTNLLTKGALRAVVLAPLMVGQTPFGILIAARYQPCSFNNTDCEFLNQLAEHVALAGQQAQLYANLQNAYHDLRQTQTALMQQERLRALGEMASGIAHDINNSISPIAMYADMLLEQQGLDDEVRQPLRIIQRAIHDVAKTVSRMKEFYRRHDSEQSSDQINVAQIIEQVLELTRVRWRDIPQQRGIVVLLETDVSPELPHICGVENEIRDALTNLIFNALDAMPAGGVLRISASTLDDPSEKRVEIKVTDTGIGMDEQTRRRCLEPFFTTKGERGTGLGLPMVYGMIQRHNGELTIESELGNGTTVRLALPAAPLNASLTSDKDPTVVVGSLRIFLVDDDPVILRCLSEILQSDGHLVTTADGGQDAKNLFLQKNADGRAFDLVITDLGMPYVDGRELAAFVKGLSPKIPVIMLTGWGQRLVDQHEIPSHVDRLLPKPPKIRDLRRALLELAGTRITADSTSVLVP